MREIEAIYQDGVFKPLSQVVLREKQRVRLDVHPVEENDASLWLEQTQRLQQQIMETRGLLPDSTLDIAVDRAR